MKHSQTAPFEEVKLHPFEISDIDAQKILHIITDGKCKIPGTSNVTKVQLPRGKQFIHLQLHNIYFLMYN